MSEGKESQNPMMINQMEQLRKT